MNYYPLTLSPAGADFIKKEEIFVPHAYQDSVGVWTIGYGSTMYRDGTKPKASDIITQEAATDLLLWAVEQKTKASSHLIRNPLNQNQQDSIISLIYNIGCGGFATSTVLKLINQDPNDPGIQNAFYMWCKGTINGKKVVLPGLLARRKREYSVYSKSVL